MLVGSKSERDEEPIVYVDVKGEKKELQITTKENGENYAESCIEINDEKWQWIRMEVRSREGKFMGYTNPIYRGTRASCYHTYEEARIALEVMDEN